MHIYMQLTGKADKNKQNKHWARTEQFIYQNLMPFLPPLAHGLTSQLATPMLYGQLLVVQPWKHHVVHAKY